MDAQSASEPTCTGINWSWAVGLPSCPSVLSPQECNVPSNRNASTWEPPAAIATQLLPTLKCVGIMREWKFWVPSPVCPSPFQPHVHIVPSVFNATLKPPPGLTELQLVALPIR